MTKRELKDRIAKAEKISGLHEVLRLRKIPEKVNDSNQDVQRRKA